MRGGIVIFFLLIFAQQVQAEAYEIFYENGKAGLRDESGKVVIPASFDALGWSDGSFSVVNQVTGYRQKNQWGLINLKKEFITKAEFENLTSNGADRVVASRWINPYTKKFGCLDLAGNITVPFHYDGITIHGLRAIVFLKNGTRYEYGLIDLDDKSVLPLRFREIKPIGSLRFAVQNFERKTALFSEAGGQLTEFNIDSISSFRKGKAIIYRDFKQGLIDREGQIEVEPTYREIKVRNNGEVAARKFDEWKIIDFQNRELKSIAADQLFPSQAQYILQLAGKVGSVDWNFNPAIPVQYDYLGSLQNDLAVAKQNGKYGVIGSNGKEKLPFSFDSLTIQENFIRAAIKNFGQPRWSVYDTFGVKKTERVYDCMDAFNGKFFPARNKGFAGAVDRYGKEVISCVYDSLSEFNHEMIVVKFKNQFGIIDFDERWLVFPQPNPLQLVNENLYFEKKDSITFLKKLPGEIVYFTSGVIYLKEDHLEEIMDDGTIKMISWEGISSVISSAPLPESTEKVFAESEGFRGIERDGRFGFIDDRGRLRVANRYEGIGKFNEGQAPVKILGKWGFVNKEDQIVVHPNYENVNEFQQGVAVVKRNGKLGAINKEGKVLIHFRYDSIARISDKFILVSNKKFGLAEINGNVLIETRFDFMEVLPNGHVIVKDDNKWGVLTHDGMPVIPLSYDSLRFNPETNQYLANKKAEWVLLRSGQ